MYSLEYGIPLLDKPVEDAYEFLELSKCRSTTSQTLGRT